jgi:hypothetical protein
MLTLLLCMRLGSWQTAQHTQAAELVTMLSDVFKRMRTGSFAAARG